VLNPGNRLAGLAREQGCWTCGNGRAERGPLELVGCLLSCLVERAAAPLQHDSDDNQQLGQGFVRYRQGEAVFTAGRELLSWGPANFRSPSNRSTDAGRTNPLAATPGVDLLRYTQQIAPGWRAGGGYVFSTSQITPATELGHSAWPKLDQQGSSHLASLVLSQQRGGATFVGGFAQWTPDDAWLLYAEFGSTRPPGQLQPQALAPARCSVGSSPRRGSDSLLGASYTLESGHVLTGEAAQRPALRPGRPPTGRRPSAPMPCWRATRRWATPAWARPWGRRRACWGATTCGWACRAIRRKAGCTGVSNTAASWPTAAGRRWPTPRRTSGPRCRVSWC
jgi:hypothetical protein